jgi:hypothetical protein
MIQVVVSPIGSVGILAGGARTYAEFLAAGRAELGDPGPDAAP